MTTDRQGQLAALLDLAGAEATPGAATRVAELERQLGRPLPPDARALLLRPPRLIDPDAEDHPAAALDFFGGLPDVESFLERLATEIEGPLLAVAQLGGLIPLSVRLDRGFATFALVAIDGYDDRTGGLYYYDERELGALAPDAADFLAAELETYLAAADAGDLYDCYRFDIPADTPLPELEPLGPETLRAFHAVARRRGDGRDRWWICEALRGEIAAWSLDALPTPETWELDRDAVAARHGDAMYWLLAHAILGNRDELADAIDLSRQNPSRLVAALRDYLLAHPDFTDRHRRFRDQLYDLARAVEL